MRELFTRVIRSRLRAGQALDTQVSKRSIVFAPHPDDETLGCGGTIARKLAAGEQLTVVVMTDGAGSHAHLMPAQEVIAIRRQELYNATAVLGLAPQQVITLNFPDSQLQENAQAAGLRVANILQELSPTEVFVPTRWDTPKDHYATYDIVQQAVTKCSPGTAVYEYPVWFWMQWPFAKPQLRGRSELPQWFIANSRDNLRLIRHFTNYFDITPFIQVKQEALSQYASQMTRLVDDARWLTLKDVADGDFLRCFSQTIEVFYRSR